MNKSVAILGVSGYIGRSMFSRLQDFTVVSGFSRNLEATREILKKYHIPDSDVQDYENLNNVNFDILINAAGIGSPARLSQDPSAVFKATEEMDQIIFDYLDTHKETKVYNLSSGAVHDKNTQVLSDDFDIGTISEKDFYSVAKIKSEAAHRNHADLNIIDIRVFAFISRYLDLNDTFLLSQVAKHLKTGEVFVTGPDDIIRDYTRADDILAAIRTLEAHDPKNDAMDIRSAAPVSKFSLLESLKEEFGLVYKVEDRTYADPTGSKSVYAPVSSKLDALGYVPGMTSLENIITELRFFMSDSRS